MTVYAVGYKNSIDNELKTDSFQPRKTLSEVLMRKFALVMSFVLMSLALVMPSYAGKMKALLMDAEDQIHAEMSSLGDYEIEIQNPTLVSTANGVTVTATVLAFDLITGKSTIYICDVQFQGTFANYEPTDVQCY